jgi:predicted proteasome-type protease
VSSLFGSDPPKTINVELAARIIVDGHIIGHAEAAAFHGIGESSITRLHRFRAMSDKLETAVKAALVSMPNTLTNRRRATAWATRTIGCDLVALEEDGEEVLLRAFYPLRAVE